MRVIGISGEMGCGKDTVADILVEHYGFRKVTIGKYIRKELSEATWLLQSGKIMPNSVRRLLREGGIQSRLNKLTIKPTTPDARESLQWYGQMARISDPNHWTSQILCEIRDCGADNIVWCDVRMPDEAQAVRMLGGEMWNITRMLVRRRIEYIRALRNHVTETALRDYEFDRVIRNNETRVKLARKIHSIVKDWE